jgi:hypothetical protein
MDIIVQFQPGNIVQHKLDNREIMILADNTAPGSLCRTYIGVYVTGLGEYRGATFRDFELKPSMKDRSN